MAYLSCEDGHVAVNLEQGLFVAVIGELVRYSHGVNQRLLVGAGSSSLAASAHPARQHFHLTHHLLDLRYARDGAGCGVPLLGEPFSDVGLAADEPRVDEDVVVNAAAMLDGVSGPR